MQSGKSEQSSDPITGKFRFIRWQDLYEREKPFQLLTQIPADAEEQRVSNLVFEDKEVEVHDARKLDPEPTLDTHGFMLKQVPLPSTDFNDLRSIEDTYFPEVERLIKQGVDDANQVFIFDFRLRNTLPEYGPGTILDFNDHTKYLRPAIHFHVDQSPSGVLSRIMMQLKEQSSTLLQKRVQIVNIWRPLVDCVGDWPLGLCDGSTADYDDFIETDHIRKQYQGSSMYMKRNPKQKFYYYSRQGKEDVLFIKIFDSKKDGIRAPYGPHAAFEMPHEVPGGVPRKSIEVRCLVFSSTDAVVPAGWHKQGNRDRTLRHDLDSTADAEMFLPHLTTPGQSAVQTTVQ